MRYHLTGSMLGILTVVSGLEACTGLFGGIYDDPEEMPQPVIVVEEEEDEAEDDSQLPTVSGTLYIDATSWNDWYYVDLQALANPDTREQAIAQTTQPYPIPTASDENGDNRKSGIYTYWFDVWGKGLSVNELRQFNATVSQPEPAIWSFAVHRNNVRTNNGGAYETQLTDIKQLTMSKEELLKLPYTVDEWTEKDVWADQSQMLNSLIGCQGISINPVLSSWLHLDIPPMPPAFTHNDHVFLLKHSDGTVAALRLSNYMSPAGTKCCLTIQYKYPL